MQVGQVDLPAVVDMLAHLNRQRFYSGAKNQTIYFDLHVRRWFDKAERSMVGVRVHQPERDGDVVVLTLDKHHRLDKLGKILHPGERIRYYGFYCGNSFVLVFLHVIWLLLYQCTAGYWVIAMMESMCGSSVWVDSTL